MRTIPLTKGYVAIVDDEDFEWLNQWKWTYGNHGYAIRNVKVNGSWTHVLMHRIIMNLEKTMEVDHRNAQKLDNRRSNLRICTSSENKCNQRIRRSATKTSSFKGVYFATREQRWFAKIEKDGKHYVLGRFKSEIEAAKAYNKIASNLHGDFARLNKV